MLRTRVHVRPGGWDLSLIRNDFAECIVQIHLQKFCSVFSKVVNEFFKEYRTCCMRGNDSYDSAPDTAVCDGLLYFRCYIYKSRSSSVRSQVDLFFVNLHYFPSLSLYAFTIASAISCTRTAGDGALRIPEVAPVPSAPSLTTL